MEALLSFQHSPTLFSSTHIHGGRRRFITLPPSIGHSPSCLCKLKVFPILSSPSPSPVSTPAYSSSISLEDAQSPSHLEASLLSQTVAQQEAPCRCNEEEREGEGGGGGGGDEEEELAIRKSLRERRECVREVLKEAMRAANLSKGYSADVLSFMGELVDRVILRAVAMKRVRRFANVAFSHRAQLYIDQSEVIRSIKWMKHNEMTSPQIGKLVSLVEDYDGVLHQRIEWLKSIRVRGRDIGVVLCRQPHILERTMEELKFSVQFLQEEGVKNEWIGFLIRRCPSVLSFESGELRKRVALLKDLGISTEDFGRVCFKFPPILGRFTLEDMHAKLEYMKTFCLEESLIAKALVEKPELLAIDIKDGWIPMLNFFYYIGVDRSGLRRIFAVKPSVFCLDLTDSIAPKIQFLRQIGVHKEAISNMIVSFPPFLNYSLDKKIQVLVSFLLEEVGVPAEDLGKVIASCPELVGCSIKNKLLITARYFITQGVRKKQLGSMVVDFPSLFKYSLPVIHSKLTYLTKVMGRPLKEMVEFPRFFSYSLQFRIKPRHERLVEKKLQFKLRYMLACSDEDFQERIDIACTPLGEFNEKK